MAVGVAQHLVGQVPDRHKMEKRCEADEQVPDHVHRWIPLVQEEEDNADDVGKPPELDPDHDVRISDEGAASHVRHAAKTEEHVHSQDELAVPGRLPRREDGLHDDAHSHRAPIEARPNGDHGHDLQGLGAAAPHDEDRGVRAGDQEVDRAVVDHSEEPGEVRNGERRVVERGSHEHRQHRRDVESHRDARFEVAEPHDEAVKPAPGLEADEGAGTVRDRVEDLHEHEVALEVHVASREALLQALVLRPLDLTHAQRRDARGLEVQVL
mmetsp:Transcript_23786/g.62689  ORF Transcript_23786/g.62689 Transcript_23786/m.62689 type:complete len:268 (-) Transcript_23786:986-1789(-)